MKVREFFLYIVVCAVSVLAAGGNLRAFERELPKGPIHIAADHVTFDGDRQLYAATGDAVITFAGGFLKADTITFNRETKDAEAEGHVIIESEGDIIRGEQISWNLNTKTGTMRGGMLFFEQQHFYIAGTEIKKTADATYSIRDATATTCDGDCPDWRFTGKEVRVTVDGYGTVKHGTFQVKNFPVLYAPYLIFPAKTTRQSGVLLPRLAYSRDKHGWDLTMPLYWALSQYTDATFYQRYMDKRGFQEGMEFRYCINENSFGTVYADYLNDSKKVGAINEDFLAREWQDPQKRWSYYINHETTFSSGFYIRTDVKKVSDNWYFKDFDSYNYYLEHYGGSENGRFKKVSFVGDKALPSLESTARLVKDGELWNLTALAQYTDDFQSYSNDATLQKYPEITLTAVTQPLFGSAFDVELDSTYGYYYRTEGLKGYLVDVHPTFSLPLNFGDYLQFTPEIGVRETVWDSTHTTTSVGGKRGSRELFSAGAALSTEVQRVFDVHGDTVEKIKHTVTPEVTYTYLPNVYQGDIADYVVVVEEQNAIACSLTNTLIARLKDDDGSRSYREIFRLKVGQIYDIKEARRDLTGETEKRRPFGVLDMECDCNPFHYVSFESDAQYDVNSGGWKELNSSIGIRDWRGDALACEYRYTQSSVEEIDLSLGIKVTDDLGLAYTVKRNELDKKYLETAYGFTYTSQCWSVEAQYSDSPDDREFMVIVSLYGIGKVGKVTATSVGE